MNTKIKEIIINNNTKEITQTNLRKHKHKQLKITNIYMYILRTIIKHNSTQKHTTRNNKQIEFRNNILTKKTHKTHISIYIYIYI